MKTNLKIVPNQKGFFCKYEELYKEKEINQNFKIMLKNYFYYDISDFLVHKKFEKIVLKEFSINEQIIEKIKNSFYNKLNDNNKNNDNDDKNKKIYDVQYMKYIEKSIQLIHFYPKNEEEYIEENENDKNKDKKKKEKKEEVKMEEEKEDLEKEINKEKDQKKNKENIIKKFISCYKVISGEKIEEEEINTTDISIWDKAIKILLIDLLKKINEDENMSGTIKRLKITEDKENDIFNSLNNFYYIIFYYLREDDEKKIINDFSFIPNELKEYKCLNDVYINTDIDKEIKNIFSYLVKDNKYENILIHEKINLPIPHKEKCLVHIASEIDKMIKTYYTKIDAIVDKSKVKIEETYKTVSKKLITEWFKMHKKEKEKFEFINDHIVEIYIKIILEGKYKELFDDLIIEGNTEDSPSFLNKKRKEDDIKEDSKTDNRKKHNNNTTKSENSNSKPTNLYFNENPILRCPSPK